MGLYLHYQNVAKTLAEECVRAHASLPYAAYIPSQQKEIIRTINAKLAQESIHAIGEDVVAWKMHAVIRDVIRAREKGREQSNQWHLTFAEHELIFSTDLASPSASIQLSPTNQSARAAAAARPFDPVRDI